MNKLSEADISKIGEFVQAGVTALVEPLFIELAAALDALRELHDFCGPPPARHTERYDAVMKAAITILKRNNA